MLCLLFSQACVGNYAGDDSDGKLECVEGTTAVRFDQAEPPLPGVHQAVGMIPGGYTALASWRGERPPTTVTTTLSYEGESYDVVIADFGLYCSVSLDVPIVVTLQTDDGNLSMTAPTVWVTAPEQENPQVVWLATALSADPHDTDWLPFSVWEMWPDISSADDDAMLWLELEYRAGVLWGRLEYEKREIVDATTVFYYRDTLLEWSGT